MTDANQTEQIKKRIPLSLSIRFKYPDVFPFPEARGDLARAMSLYRHIEFAIGVRSTLEVYGPYQPKLGYFSEDIRFGGGLGIILSSDLRNESNIAPYKEKLLSGAGQQFVLSVFSIFQFYIANTIIAIWLFCEGKNNSSKQLTFLWDEKTKKRFMDHKITKSINDAKWMEDNHRWHVLEQRIAFLEEMCGFKITAHQTKTALGEFDWKRFIGYLSLRHGVAHGAGRYSLYSKKRLELRDITQEEVHSLFLYTYTMFEFMQKDMYEQGILRDDYKE